MSLSQQQSSDILVLYYTVSIVHHHDHDIICNDYDQYNNMCKQKRRHFHFRNGWPYIVKYKKSFLLNEGGYRDGKL